MAEVPSQSQLSSRFALEPSFGAPNSTIFENIFFCGSRAKSVSMLAPLVLKLKFSSLLIIMVIFLEPQYGPLFHSYAPCSILRSACNVFVYIELFFKCLFTHSCDNCEDIERVWPTVYKRDIRTTVNPWIWIVDILNLTAGTYTWSCSVWG